LQPISIAEMRAAGVSPCLHMVVEAADPGSPLRVARTCFLGYGCKPDHLFRGGVPAAPAAARVHCAPAPAPALSTSSTATATAAGRALLAGTAQEFAAQEVVLDEAGTADTIYLMRLYDLLVRRAAPGPTRPACACRPSSWRALRCAALRCFPALLACTAGRWASQRPGRALPGQP
jgi:hypothetical protein